MIEDLIKYLSENDYSFEMVNDEKRGIRVYVFEKKEYDLRKNHPRKYKDLYIPYIRIDDVNSDNGFYTRENGWTREYGFDTLVKHLECYYL